MPPHLDSLALFGCESCDLHIISLSLKRGRDAFMFYERILFWRLPSAPAEALNYVCAQRAPWFSYLWTGLHPWLCWAPFSFFYERRTHRFHRSPAIFFWSQKSFHHQGRYRNSSCWPWWKDFFRSVRPLYGRPSDYKPGHIFHFELEGQLPKHDFVMSWCSASCSHQIKFKVIVYWQNQQATVTFAVFLQQWFEVKMLRMKKKRTLQLKQLVGSIKRWFTEN